MYKQWTVLKRKDQYAFDPKDEERAIYNDVKVIGVSQVQDSLTREDWDGVQAEAISIKPIEFGPVIDLPLGELEAKYDVVEIPDAPKPEIPPRTVVEENVGPTPEQQFAKAALEARNAEQVSA